MVLALTRNEMAVIAHTVLLEAEDQAFHGKLAVAFVIKNRMEKSHKSAYDICWAPWQFSCWLENLDKIGKRMTNAPGEMVQDSWKAVELAITESVSDPTQGATHYLNIEVTKQQRGDGKLPSWVEAMEHTVTIGAHDFYKEK